MIDWEALAKPTEKNSSRFKSETEAPAKKVTPEQAKLILGGLIFLTKLLSKK